MQKQQRKTQKRVDNGARVLIRVKWVEHPWFCFHCYSVEFLLSDYEEDFEVDEESQDERAEDEDQVEDQMCGTSKSPTEGERDNSSPKKEIEISSEKALDVCGSESREDDVCLDSDEEDKQGRLQKSVTVCLKLDFM